MQQNASFPCIISSGSESTYKALTRHWNNTCNIIYLWHRGQWRKQLIGRGNDAVWKVQISLNVKNAKTNTVTRFIWKLKSDECKLILRDANEKDSGNHRHAEEERPLQNVNGAVLKSSRHKTRWSYRYWRIERGKWEEYRRGKWGKIPIRLVPEKWLAECNLNTSLADIVWKLKLWFLGSRNSWQRLRAVCSENRAASCVLCEAPFGRKRPRGSNPVGYKESLVSGCFDFSFFISGKLGNCHKL